MEQKEHRIYYYNSVHGLAVIPKAKCRCGKEMTGIDEIKAHEEETDD